MAEQADEQNKTEDASPFKLVQARKKGTVAKGGDIAFVAVLAGIAIWSQIFGADAFASALQAMRRLIVSGITGAGSPQALTFMAKEASEAVLPVLFSTGLLICLTIILLDIIQMRGVIFTSHPIKPDFTRLNPAKGLKRLFSLRMLKETGKSLLKLFTYCMIAGLIIRSMIFDEGLRASSGGQLLGLLWEGSSRLWLWFILAAVFLAIIDQLVVRQEFAKQMRMSRREVTKEHREREGDPQQKRKRKQMHADYVQQQRQSAHVAGSDVLVVNPQHFAVALSYRPETMDAPRVKARGRNAFALKMRSEANRLGILIVEAPALARSLYKNSIVDMEIPPDLFGLVADIYIMLQSQENLKKSEY